MDAFYWAVVVCLAALSGFFGLTRDALGSFRRVALEEAFKGPDSQARLDKLEKNLKALQLTTGLCRAICQLVLVAMLIFLFGAYANFWASLAAVAVAGTLIAVLAIAIPHAWAAYAGEKVLAATLGSLMAVRVALYPIVWIMLAFDLPIRRLTGIGDEEHENGDSAKQEILQAASEGQAEGAVDAEEVQMIESVMEFGETQAGEIMTPRTDIFALPVETPWQEAIDRIVKAGHTRVPIYEGDLDHIVGLIYAKDMLAGTAKPTGIQDIARKSYFVPETKPLDDLLREFKSRKVHMAVVLDEYGGTAGLVTIEDVVEEIVGDIADEYDPTTQAPMRRIDERNAEIDGRFYIDELNDAMGLELPEDEDYDTIAGFVFSELGYIPVVGEKLERHGATFTVTGADERKITQLHVELTKAGEQGDE